jgi:hypothetical protein
MGKKLLMIDDDAGIARVVGLAARELGMEFRAIASPLTAKEMFAAYRPDMVIIDMIMAKEGWDRCPQRNISDRHSEQSRSNFWFWRYSSAPWGGRCQIPWRCGFGRTGLQCPDERICSTRLEH